MRNGFTIVDGHAHTFSSDAVAGRLIPAFNKTYTIEFVNSGNGTINDLLHNMDKNGIDYTVMANFAPPRILHDNNLWAISEYKANNRLIPLVSFHPSMEGNLAGTLEEYIREGAKGIKIHPMAQGFEPDCQELYPVYEYCHELAFPIVFHCGRVSNARLNEFADLCMILPVIEKYHRIPIVLTHMADGNVDDVIRLSQNYENVYFDTSIVITGYPPIRRVNEPSWLEDDMVVDIVERIGAERIVFGSDYPWGSPGHDVDRFLGMDLSDEQKKLIFSENSLKIFKIKTGVV